MQGILEKRLVPDLKIKGHDTYYCECDKPLDIPDWGLGHDGKKLMNIKNDSFQYYSCQNKECRVYGVSMELHEKCIEQNTSIGAGDMRFHEYYNMLQGHHDAHLRDKRDHDWDEERKQEYRDEIKFSVLNIPFDRFETFQYYGQTIIRDNDLKCDWIYRSVDNLDMDTICKFMREVNLGMMDPCSWKLPNIFQLSSLEAENEYSFDEKNPLSFFNAVKVPYEHTMNSDLYSFEYKLYCGKKADGIFLVRGADHMENLQSVLLSELLRIDNEFKGSDSSSRYREKSAYSEVQSRKINVLYELCTDTESFRPLNAYELSFYHNRAKWRIDEDEDKLYIENNGEMREVQHYLVHDCCDVFLRGTNLVILKTKGENPGYSCFVLEKSQRVLSEEYVPLSRNSEFRGLLRALKKYSKSQNSNLDKITNCDNINSKDAIQKLADRLIHMVSVQDEDVSKFWARDNNCEPYFRYYADCDSWTIDLEEDVVLVFTRNGVESFPIKENVTSGNSEYWLFHDDAAKRLVFLDAINRF
jgi:hypothetical protein